MTTIIGTEGDDILVGTDQDDSIDGLGGNDSLEGGEGMDTLTGGAGDDDLRGGDGDDILNGNDGEDYLQGGAGSDDLDGGAGPDTVIYAEEESETQGPVTSGVFVDLINGSAIDGWGNSDTLINIENAQGTSFDDQLIGSEIRNEISGGDGNDEIDGGSGDDSLGGDGGDDRIDGGAGDDALYGGDGNDELLGGEGNDNISGGPGDDLIDGGAGSNVVLYGPVSVDDIPLLHGVRVDLANGFAEDGWGGRDTLIAIDHVEGTNLNDVLIGNANGNALDGLAGDDTLIGGAGNDELHDGAGDDSLSAGAGDDYIYAGSGNDRIDGGAGLDDAIEYGDRGQDAAGAILHGVVVDLRLGLATDGWNGNDTLSNIEHVSGTHLSDEIAGNEADNELAGGDGDDVLQGDAGNDRIRGNAGNDLLQGGPGNDFLFGDAIERSEDNDVDLSATAGDDVLEGGAGDDILYGGAGDDILRGGDGDDELNGGSGNDTLDGGAGFDVADFSDDGTDEAGPAFQSVTIDLANGTATDGWGGRDRLLNIEQVRGGELGDTLIGDDADNVLDGGAGADQMRGGAGRDTYYVDNTNDEVIETGNQILEIPVGSNRRSLSHEGDARAEDVADDIDNVIATISYTLADFVENLTLDGAENIDGTGNDLDNVLIGNDGDNVLITGAGAYDRLIGRGGNDLFIVNKVEGTTLIKDLAGEGNALDLSEFVAGDLTVGSAGYALVLENASGGRVAIYAFFANDDTPVPQIDLGSGQLDVSNATNSSAIAEILGAEYIGDVVSIIDDDGNLYDSSLLTREGIEVTATDAQLYRTYSGALGRDPDDAGYEWWLNEILTGRHDLRSMAAGFIYSDEFTSFFGLEEGNSIDNADFVNHMYHNVFGREPDQGGFDFWFGELESGHRTQVDALVEMTQSNEYVQLTTVTAVDYLVG